MKKSAVEVVEENDWQTVEAKVNDRIDVMEEKGWGVDKVDINLIPGHFRTDSSGFQDIVRDRYVGTILYKRDV